MARTSEQEWEDAIERADHARAEAKYQRKPWHMDTDMDDFIEPEAASDVCRHGYPLDVWCDKCELGLF